MNDLGPADMPGQIRRLELMLRQMQAQLSSALSGNRVNLANVIGILPPGNGGSGSNLAPLGATIWQNNSGGTRDAGDVVVRDGDRLFDVTTSVSNPDVLGILAGAVAGGATVADGLDGIVRHVGYQETVRVQGTVAAGDFLRSSATSSRAESAGATPDEGVFGIALTANASGAGTVAAWIFPVLRLIGSAGITPSWWRRIATTNNNANATIAVNSTSYTAPSNLAFYHDGELQPATHFRITARAATSEVSPATVTLQLATNAAPGTGLSAAGNDLVVTGNALAYYDSGWIALSSAISSFILLQISLKGSNGTVDFSPMWVDIGFKYDV